MRRGTISKSSLKILEKVREDPGTTQTEIAEELELSFTAISRHFRGDNRYDFLSKMIEKEDGDDGREKRLYIADDSEEDADILVDALHVIRHYEDNSQEPN